MIGSDELLRNNVKMTSPFGFLTKENGSRVNLRQFRIFVLATFDVVYDLLLKRCTATLNPFAKYSCQETMN